VQSGAFGLCVVDLSAPPTWPAPKDMSEKPAPQLRGEVWQARLATLARMHASRVVVPTRAASGWGSLGPMVGLRVQPASSPCSPTDAADGAPALRRGPWGCGSAERERP